MRLIPRAILPIAILITLVTGCDDRVTQVAREAADRQAQQNTAMANIVEADAKARQEIVGVHRDLQAERTRLDTGWTALESDRKEIAGERRTESTLASMTTIAGSILLAAVLLGFCWFILIGARQDHASVELTELLVQRIATRAARPVGPERVTADSSPTDRQQTRRTPIPPHPSGKTPKNPQHGDYIYGQPRTALWSPPRRAAGNRKIPHPCRLPRPGCRCPITGCWSRSNRRSPAMA